MCLSVLDLSVCLSLSISSLPPVFRAENQTQDLRDAGQLLFHGATPLPQPFLTFKASVGIILHNLAWEELSLLVLRCNQLGGCPALADMGSTVSSWVSLGKAPLLGGAFGGSFSGRQESLTAPSNIIVHGHLSGSGGSTPRPLTQEVLSSCSTAAWAMETQGRIEWFCCLLSVPHNEQLH